MEIPWFWIIIGVAIVAAIILSSVLLATSKEIESKSEYTPPPIHDPDKKAIALLDEYLDRNQRKLMKKSSYIISRRWPVYRFVSEIIPPDRDVWVIEVWKVRFLVRDQVLFIKTIERESVYDTEKVAFV